MADKLQYVELSTKVAALLVKYREAYMDALEKPLAEDPNKYHDVTVELAEFLGENLGIGAVRESLLTDANICVRNLYIWRHDPDNEPVSGFVKLHEENRREAEEAYTALAHRIVDIISINHWEEGV